MTRKPIQVSAAFHPNSGQLCAVVLCDDGSLWAVDATPPYDSSRQVWYPVSRAPQPTGTAR